MTGEMMVRFEFNLDPEDEQAIKEDTMTEQDLDWEYYIDKAVSADLETIEVA